ncbi:hypothetical protein A9174_34720 (plasmid) [Mesorhizobium loti NZP2037]|nr:putative sulfate exporter family transporter [Mesorhizobium loti]ANN62062.1 hypothetical protein A9174_34720 [Mesorhizobium loti NZP2037]
MTTLVWPRFLTPEGAREIMPGMVLCLTVAMAATFLSTHYSAPVILFALLLGMAFNFIGPAGKCIPGVALASRPVLRIGVALLGARITLSDMLALGPLPIFLAIGGLATTILLGLGLGRFFGRPAAFGILTGGAVGICGASAALALTSVLPKGERGISERDTIFTVVAVTALSTVAMIAYPVLASFFGFDDRLSGIFIGATVHDVAQVVGAGYSISREAGDTATIVKLLRVAMLVSVVATITLLMTRSGPGTRARFPLFLIGFVLLVIINSVGLIPAQASAALADASRWALVIAIAGLGMKTSLKDFFEVGPRAMAIIVAETVWIAAFAAIVLSTLA